MAGSISGEFKVKNTLGFGLGRDAQHGLSLC
jgi:hypothetical protein